jgi:hypothetical protein
MNDNFLPEGYETPEAESHYMELTEGLNSIRILSRAVVGYEWWTEGEGGERRPARVRTEAEVPEEFRTTFDRRSRARHFWAFVVYNYDALAVQVLVVKQQTIMGAIEALIRNAKWGDPRDYDLLIEKSRTGTRERDVEYSVMPEPKAPVDPGIVELAKQVSVDLEALYSGGDPFAGDEPKRQRRQHRQPNGHHAHA